MKLRVCWTSSWNGSLAVGHIPDRVQGLIHSVKEYERLTVSAAVSGNYEQALLALTVHPLVCSYFVS